MYVRIACFFSVIVEASKPTLQYNRVKAYDYAMGSKAVAYTYCVEVTSFIRRYHAYQDFWQPCVGEVLALEKEALNCKDGQAVAVMRSQTIVGHIP